jgi:hypothetical protein
MNTEMKKETAVDFLFKSIYGETGHFDAYTTQGTPAYDAYKQAKAMEKEQIIDAHWDGSIYWDSEKTEEQYYTKTYGGDK